MALVTRVKMKHQSIVTLVSLCILPFLGVGCRTVSIQEQYVTKQYRDGVKRYEEAVSRETESQVILLDDFLSMESYYDKKSPKNVKISASISGERITLRSNPFTCWRRDGQPYVVYMAVHVFDYAYKSVKVRSASLQTSRGEINVLPVWDEPSPFKRDDDADRFKSEYPTATARVSCIMFKYDKPLPYESDSTANVTVNLSLIKYDGTEQQCTSSWTFVPLHGEETISWLHIIYTLLFFHG